MRRTLPSAPFRFVLMMVVMCLGLLALPAVANAAPALTDISGTVTDATNGVHLQGITVTAYYFDGVTWSPWDSTLTDYDGNYVLGVPQDDTYHIGFSDENWSLYTTEFWNNTATVDAADPVAVVGDTPVTGINAALARQTGTGAGGSITGRVTAAGTGWNLGSKEVACYYDDGGTWVLRSYTLTGSDGVYLLTGLPADTYLVRFHDYDGVYPDMYYNSRADEASADPIVVGADADVGGINQALTPYLSAIAGTVRDEVTGLPVSGINCYLYRDGGGYGNVLTDETGRYMFSNLAAGDYTVYYADSAGLYYSEWWQDAEDGGAATAVPLDGTTDYVFNLDAEIALGGIISGTVTGSDSGLGIASASVSLYVYDPIGDTWSWRDSTGTDAQGDYAFSVLEYGTYRVNFWDYEYVYLPEYYNESPGLLDATDIAVSATPQTGIDAVLERGGRITGTVVDDVSFAAIESANVVPHLYHPDTGEWQELSGHARWTDASGVFTLTGLPFGTYRFAVSASSHAREYWPDAQIIDDGTSWTFTDDTLQSGLDFMIARTGSISGTVRNLGGTPLHNVAVYLYEPRADSGGTPYWSQFRTAVTDVSGAYTFGSVAPGEYRLQYYDQNTAPPYYLPVFYAGKPNVWTGDSVWVQRGQAVTNIDVAMSSGASISGTVRDESSAPLQSVAVRAFAYDPSEDDWEPVPSSPTVYTDASGNYTLTGLADDAYRLGFYKNGYAITYYTTASNVFDATDVNIIGGTSLSGRDVMLIASGSVSSGWFSGTITSDATGLGIAGVRVIAYKCDPIAYGGWEWYNSTMTNAAGSYSMSAVPGVYRLEIRDDNEPKRFLTEFFNGAAAAKDADHLVVTSGDTVTVDAGLATGGRISGTLTDEFTGLPLSTVQVSLYSRSGIDWHWLATVGTDQDGAYEFGGLNTGSYRIYASEWTNEYRSEHYDNQPSIGMSTPVLVDVGETVPNIDIALTPYGSVSGTVTGDDGRPIRGALVVAFARTPDEWQWYTGMATEADGEYSLPQLPANDYILRFADNGDYGFERYLMQYHPDATRTADATVIAINGNAVIVNQTLTSTGTWGDIAGTAIDAVSGDPVPDIAITRYDPDGGNWIDSGWGTATADDGSYTLQWVPIGTDYRVAADPALPVEGYTWWTDVYRLTFHDADAAAADGLAVAVAADTITPDVDIDVTPEADVGYITGHVIEDDTSADVPGAIINLWRLEGVWNNFATFTTDVTGHFTRAVPAGTYAIELDDWPKHAHEYYEDVPGMSPNDATPVTVTAAASTEVTASLEPLGSVAGTVTAESGGAPLGDIHVTLYRPNGLGWDWASDSSTLEDGSYEIPGVPYGPAYAVAFTDYDGLYVSEVYDNQPDLYTADSFPVGSAPVTGIDAALADAATISGVVTDADTLAPVADVYVVAYQYDRHSFGWSQISGTYTDATGAYTIGGLRAGNYRLGFSAWSAGYANEYHDNVRNVADAMELGVATAEDLTGVNAALEKRGSISGTITDVISGAPLQNAYVYAYSYRAADDSWQYAVATSTNSLGQYTLSGASPDAYRLYVSRSGYHYEYLHNKYDTWAANDIVVGNGEDLTGVDEALSPGAPITGTLRDGDGTGIANAYATALRYDPRYAAWVYAGTGSTDSNGAYVVSGLGDSDYRMLFSDPNSSRYLSEYYDDAATPETGTTVSVIDGVGASGIDAVLSPWVAPGQGTIAGTVRDAGTTAVLENIRVDVARYFPEGGGGWSEVDSTYSAANGTYSLLLDAGAYRLRFTDESGLYQTEVYHDAAENYWDGTDVAVTADTTTTANEGLKPAGRITGFVTAETGGAPLANMGIEVYYVSPESGTLWIGSSQTGPDGSYTCGGLAAGSYLLYFYDSQSDYLAEYYDNATDMSWATWITVGEGELRSGVNAQLASAGSISGSLTNEDTGRPAENMLVRLYIDQGFGTFEYNSTWTDELGVYEFRGLNDADYYLEFEDSSSPTGFQRFLPEFYLDAPDLDSATPITVANHAESADAQLTSTGTWGDISGTITDGITGGPVPEMPIELYEWTGAEFADSGLYTYSAADGTYVFKYVPDGSYRVWANASASYWSSVYQSTAHLDASSVADGVTIALPGGTYAADAHVHMIRQPDVGWIDGTVRSDETSAPIAGIRVAIFNDGGSHLGDVTTAADGTWGRALVADTYVFEFYDPAGVYAFEWYDDQLTYDDANRVTLAAGGQATVNEDLATAGHITGTVSSASGSVDTWVTLYDAAWNYLNQVYTDGGAFEFGGLRAGDYYVYFGSTGQYLGEYWDNRSTWGDPITVAAGQTVDGIDAVLSEGGTISGTISSDDGLLDSSVYVSYYATTPLGWEWTDAQWVSEGLGDWAFESDALIPGDYKIMFYDSNGRYDAQWYEGTTDVDTATPVAVTDLETTPVELVCDGLPPDVNTDAVASYDNLASIEISATDLVSGVSITYDVDGDGAVTASADTTTVAVSGWGDHYMYYWATDAFGHESDTGARVDFTIADTLAPTVDSDALATYGTTATVTITASDEADGSGVASVSYKLDTESTQTVAASSAQVEVGGIGDHTLVFWAEDNAGNESGHTTDQITIADTEPPTVHDDAVASYNDTAAIHLTATDNVGGSGIDYITYQLDGGAWVDDPGPAVTVTVAATGDHTLSYKAVDLAGNESAVTSVDFTVVSTGLTEVPIAGANRYATAVEISKAAFPTGSDWVVIATGNNWPDALGGSALAGALDGPILLTDTMVLPADVATEIDRLGATKAIILGGTAAVGTPVETALDALLGAANVDRIAGSNRYLTADLVGARAIDELGAGYDGTAFVATGANYPDALAAAPLSAGLHWPLFLTKPTGIDPGTTAAMAGVDQVLILGGTSVVPSGIETGLDARYGAANVERLAGSNRYATAVAVATYGVNHGLHWNELAIATGEKFPDALAGGILQGRDGSVMLLTRTSTLEPSVAAVLTANKAVISEVRYLGGLNAVSQAVRDAVVAALE